MAASSTHTLRTKHRTLPRLTWRGVLRGIGKGLVVFLVAVEVLAGLLDPTMGPAMRVTAFFVIALFCASLAYLLLVARRVRLQLPGIDEGLAEHLRNVGGATPSDEVATLEVVRLGTQAAHVTVVNDAPVPVLRAQTSITLAPEDTDGVAPEGMTAKMLVGPAFSLRARSQHTAAFTRAFSHVGIFQLESAGMRIFDLFGLFSRVCSAPGKWRVRVVPNIYRLSYGIPRDRVLMQESLGIPDSPADALDYDRVRDYRPGDPLKTIHWKIVAHSQGELYTKLFETPTITATTLTIDPFGPSTAGSDAEIAYHLHDTMLEGAFSLIEHAHENDIAGRLRFVRRDGTLVEAPWAGLATRSWFVETARRPQSTHGDATSSILAVQALRTVHEGYAIFATSCLTEESVEALIAAHHAGVPLLVVHALPRSGTLATSQRTFDKRLRAASITVVALTDGTQIVREVSAS